MAPCLRLQRVSRIACGTAGTSEMTGSIGSTSVPGRTARHSMETWKTGCTLGGQRDAAWRHGKLGARLIAVTVPVGKENWCVVDLANDGKRPIELKGQLVVGPLRHRCLHIWLQLQKHQVTHCKVALRTPLARLLLHAVLGSLEMLLQQVLYDCPFIQPRVQRWYQTGGGGGDRPKAGLMTEHNLERSHTYGRVGRGVVPKLSDWNPMAPPFQAGMSKTAEEGFKTLVHPFRLPVGLRMICRAHV